MIFGKTRFEKLLEIRRMSPAKVIAIMRHKGLLRVSQACLHCETQMDTRARSDVIDDMCWVCNNTSCKSCLTTLSIRTGSFFKSMRLSLSDIFTVIILWSVNKQVKDIVSDYGISHDSVMRIFQKLRELIMKDLQADPIRLGGNGIICQIDETLLVHKVKAHVGRLPKAQIW